MRAYELTATVSEDGQLKMPDFRLSPSLQMPTVVKVIILVSEDEDNGSEMNSSNEQFSAESFRKSWQQALAGETISLGQLWEETEAV